MKKNSTHSLKNMNKQSGFAGAVFLVIALVSIVIGAIAMMSRGYTSGVTEQSAKINASVMMKQTSDMKDGFDRMLITTGLTADAVTFDANTTTGLFNPTSGAQYAVKGIPPASSVKADPTLPNGIEYTYNKTVKLPGVGDTSLEDYVVTLHGVNLLTCQAINHALFNDLLTATPASSGGSSTGWSTTPASIDDSANTAINYNLRSEGCVASSDGDYIYYKAMVEN